MKKTFFLRNLSGYLVIVALLSGAIVLVSFSTVKDNSLNLLEKNLEHTARALVYPVDGFKQWDDYEGMQRLIRDIAEGTNTRITVIDRDGVVRADSERDSQSMENHMLRPEVAQALDGGIGRSVRHSITVGKDMLYVAVPVVREGEIVGVVRVSEFIDDIDMLLGELRRRIFSAALAAVLAACLIAIGISRSIARPVADLCGAARQIGAGDFDINIFPGGDDELAELGRSFRGMAEKLQTLIQELREQKEELAIIISSIQDALAVIDSKDRILIHNEGFSAVTGSSDMRGKYIWEVLRVPECGELVSSVRSNKTTGHREIYVSGRYFMFSAAYIGELEAILILLHDITERKNLEHIKRDFIVNVSHELRTPLTAIKGYIETLEEDISAKNRKYTDIIKRNTERLINIVGDLLTLSELEEKGARYDVKQMNPAELAGHIVKMFEKSAREKNIALNIVKENSIPDITADPCLIEQMLINLIDNAVKYTEQGSVTVHLNERDGSLIMRVSDTGIGIDREHLSRIFERFYVVDKSRARKIGGTGLGLAIVKHIVMLHQGTIQVESTPGKGTQFTVTMPVNHA